MPSVLCFSLLRGRDLSASVRHTFEVFYFALLRVESIRVLSVAHLGFV